MRMDEDDGEVARRRPVLHLGGSPLRRSIRAGLPVGDFVVQTIMFLSAVILPRSM